MGQVLARTSSGSIGVLEWWLSGSKSEGLLVNERSNAISEKQWKLKLLM